MLEEQVDPSFVDWLVPLRVRGLDWYAMTEHRRRIANPIAIRRYAVAGDPSREVVLTIGKPRPDPRGDWMCSVLIEGVPKERRRRVNGVDAVQALQQAMVYARHALDACGLSVTWLDGEPGDTGLPLPIPSTWGFAFERRLERLVEDETKRMNEQTIPMLEERGRRAAAAQARKSLK
jgi:hypothetical protein